VVAQSGGPFWLGIHGRLHECQADLADMNECILHFNNLQAGPQHFEWTPDGAYLFIAPDGWQQVYRWDTTQADDAASQAAYNNRPFNHLTASDTSVSCLAVGHGANPVVFFKSDSNLADGAAPATMHEMPLDASQLDDSTVPTLNADVTGDIAALGLGGTAFTQLVSACALLETRRTHLIAFTDGKALFTARRDGSGVARVLDFWADFSNVATANMVVQSMRYDAEHDTLLLWTGGRYALLVDCGDWSATEVDMGAGASWKPVPAPALDYAGDRLIAYKNSGSSGAAAGNLVSFSRTTLGSEVAMNPFTDTGPTGGISGGWYSYRPAACADDGCAACEADGVTCLACLDGKAIDGGSGLCVVSFGIDVSPLDPIGGCSDGAVALAHVHMWPLEDGARTFATLEPQAWPAGTPRGLPFTVLHDKDDDAATIALRSAVHAGEYLFRLSGHEIGGFAATDVMMRGSVSCPASEAHPDGDTHTATVSVTLLGFEDAHFDSAAHAHADDNLAALADAYARGVGVAADAVAFVDAVANAGGDGATVTHTIAVPAGHAVAGDVHVTATLRTTRVGGHADAAQRRLAFDQAARVVSRSLGVCCVGAVEVARPCSSNAECAAADADVPFCDYTGYCWVEDRQV